MSENNSNSGKSTLKSEIQKRKTQEIQKIITAHQVARAHGDSEKTITGSQPPAAPKPALPSPSRRTAEVKAVGQRVTQTTRGVQKPLPSTQRIRLIIATAATLIVFVCLGTVLLMSQAPQQASSSPTPVPLPNVNAENIIGYFQQVGLPPTGIRQYQPHADSWLADQIVEFNVRRGTEQANVLALIYKSSEYKVPDMMRVRNNSKFKTWGLFTLTNVILLVSPESSPILRQEISSHMTQYLLAPYRSIWPTATSPAATS